MRRASYEAAEMGLEEQQITEASSRHRAYGFIAETPVNDVRSQVLFVQEANGVVSGWWQLEDDKRLLEPCLVVSHQAFSSLRVVSCKIRLLIAHCIKMPPTLHE